MTDTVRIDLHVHSARSVDGTVPVAAIAAAADAAGLAGFALTDHNTVAGHDELRSAVARYPNLRLLPGVEVSTAVGHVLALGVSEAPTPGRPLAETIEWISAHGGEPVLAHPLRWSHGVGRAAARSARVRAIEVLNGHNSGTANRGARAIARDRGVAGTGGSDAHVLSHLGRTYTEFPRDAVSVEELLEAIRRGRVVPGGTPIALGERLRLFVRTGRLRLARGLGPI